MTTFSAETYQNEYLPVAGTEVNAIVRVTASGASDADAVPRHAAEVILVDVSGSMGHPRTKLRAARDATAAAIDSVRDGVRFGIVAGTDVALEVFPGGGQLAIADARTRDAAKRAVSTLRASGGTAIGQWLERARTLFDPYPTAIRHAILLTDGQNSDETPQQLDAALKNCDGVFQCDCRGVGADWEVSELREISSRLLGDVALIRDPDQMSTDFTEMMERAMGRAVDDVALRVWIPQGAQGVFVKQVAPSIEDLTHRGAVRDERTTDFPTGAWGNETRDYHLRLEVPAREVGEEMLAARVALVVDGVAGADTKVRVVWTDDEALSTRLNAEVVRSTGHAEYAEAVQDGLAALREGDDRTATTRLGRAAQLASALDDDEKLAEVGRVVVIDDASRGTVRVKRAVDPLDIMELDTQSTKTVRTRSPDA